MNRSEKIRNWLQNQNGPRKSGQIAEGIGERGDIKVAWTVAGMYRAGILDRRTTLGGFAYFMAKPFEKRPKMSAEERRQRKNARERERHRSKGVRSAEQYREELRQKAAERAQAKAAERDARLAAQAKKQAEQRARLLRRKKPTRKTKPDKVQPVVAAKPMPAMPRAVRIETVDEWMRRTGRKPERLGIGVVSQPLKHIGHRGQNEASWKNRKKAA